MSKPPNDDMGWGGLLLVVAPLGSGDKAEGVEGQVGKEGREARGRKGIKQFHQSRSRPIVAYGGMAPCPLYYLM